MQFAKENPLAANPPQVKVKDKEEVTEEAVTTTLRRSINFYSTIQTHDGHWAGDYGGPMFLVPGLVRKKVANISFLNYVTNTKMYVMKVRLTFTCFAFFPQFSLNIRPSLHPK